MDLLFFDNERLRALTKPSYLWPQHRRAGLPGLVADVAQRLAWRSTFNSQTDGTLRARPYEPSFSEGRHFNINLPT